jgi:hypothetical protein
MDPFLAICQGLGLALAAAAVVGAAVPGGVTRAVVVLAAVPIAVVVCGASLSVDDEATWPALPVGIGAGLLAGLVGRSVVAGAERREGGQGSGYLAVLVTLVAVLVAVAALIAPPASLVVLAALVWLALARRRRAQRKYEGLRVLR